MCYNSNWNILEFQVIFQQGKGVVCVWCNFSLAVCWGTD